MGLRDMSSHEIMCIIDEDDLFLTDLRFESLSMGDKGRVMNKNLDMGKNKFEKYLWSDSCKFSK